MNDTLKSMIELAWKERSRLSAPEVKEAIRTVIDQVDRGRLRAAEPVDAARSEWRVNEWVKKAILLYFQIQEMRTMRAVKSNGTTRWSSSTVTRSWACGPFRVPWPVTEPTSPRGRF